ncbi:MAG: hypothetical protein JOZ72_02125 [Alphaproteobacteria bacterium]|nr:hypothetical protein [Alphaproteobacteria bacterium]
MTKTVFAAAAVTFALSLSAYAQGSNSGVPNTLHGSGDMMQDGPHATANPTATASDLRGENYTARTRACDAKWHEAVSNGTTGGLSAHDYKAQCQRAR